VSAPRQPSDRYIEHSLAAIGLLFEPGDIIEIRALEFRRQPEHAGITYAGYFNFENERAIAQAIRSVDGRAEGVYVVLNPFNRELLARSNNRLKARLKHTTTDADILERRWLYIDADAIRPAGISATDAEHAAALERALAIRGFLSSLRWPQPINADSGNGGHLQYRLPALPLDRAGDLVRRSLQALGAKFTDKVAKVDESTATAARICKLYGTHAGKGDSTPDRPHRRSWMLDIPERIEAVPLDALEELAALAQPPSYASNSSAKRPSQSGHGFDIDQWLADSGLDIVKGPEPYNGGRKWTLRECPFNTLHEKPVVIELPTGALAYRCLHKSCADNDWMALRRHFDPSYRSRQTERAAYQMPVEGATLLASPLTDSGNAERILSLYGRDLRYCVEMKKFLLYSGCVWTVDHAYKVSHLAKKAARLLFAAAADLPETNAAEKEYKQAVEKFARKSESARGRKDALECLAAEQGRLPISELELDPDPWKLNLANGTIDLRTGEMLPHSSDDLISKMVPIEYDPRAECPRFLQFLEEVMGISPEPGPEQRDQAKEKIRYLQKVFGCAATAKPEKVIFVLYGVGDNGKTTLVEITRAALGDKEYAGEISIGSLMARPKEAASSNAINSDLADLRGCRFVSSSEVEEGQRLSLSRVKYLTGMGQIKARRLGQDWITFKPTHKLFLDCNHKPVITDPNDAIWNRVKCIPFTITIKKIDTELPERLRGELPGILRWIVEGAVRYHREGLGGPPAEVQTATESYRQESDQLKAFLDDRCILADGLDIGAWKKAGHWVPVANFYGAYAAWAEAVGEKHPLAKTAFDDRLRRMGRKEDRLRPEGGRESKQVRVWLGIRFHTPEDDERGTCDKNGPCDSV
jgi:P4 family phage/plasmid primase-like protien